MNKKEFVELKTTLLGSQFTKKELDELEMLLRHKQNQLQSSKMPKVLDNDPALVILFNQIAHKTGNSSLQLQMLTMRGSPLIKKGKNVLEQIERQAIEFTCSGLTRVERLRVPVLFVRYASKHLAKAKAPLTPTSILNQVNNFGAFLDNNFPNYRNTPMAKLVLGKLFEE
ncbi:hypothetical protein KAR91_10950 [Candidatus Pacearchaeota archaeon]|nr:hypothetical protein [Candidatus Pacearchaeota archaeon]